MTYGYSLLLACILLFACNTIKRAEKKGAKRSRFVSFNDAHLRYEGRISEKKGEAAELYWSGSSVRLHFQGSSIKALLEDYNGQNYCNIILDNKSVRKVQIDSLKRWYTLAENLGPGGHTVELFKITQANKEFRRGYIRLYGFELYAGEVLAAPAPKSKRIEFYGNSITCGHAVEDTTGGDSGASKYENNYLSYGALTARHFDAQYSCIAVSGIGLMAGFRKQIMPEVYNLRNPFDSTDIWNFSAYQPRVVVFDLGQNDQAIIGRPTDEQFKKRFGTTAPTEDFIIQSYTSFIKKLRGHYPEAFIICVLGNMDITKEGSPWPGWVQKAVQRVEDKKVYAHFFPYKGTPGHPRAKEQAVMAGSLIRFIDEHVQW